MTEPTESINTTESSDPVQEDTMTESHPARATTIVWGLVIAAIGTGILAAALGVRFDHELAAIILIAAAGLALVVGSLFRSRRKA